VRRLALFAPFELLALLACSTPPPTRALPPEAAPALSLAPGQVADVALTAEGRADVRLATPGGTERFVVILASSRLSGGSEPSHYTLSPGNAPSASPSALVTGCALSPERFAGTVVASDPPPSGTPPREGATRTLHISTRAGNETIQACALSVGEHAAIWADTTHPTSLDADFVLQFRDDFERVILPRARQVFGTEPDLDQDGRIQLVFTRLTRDSGVAFFSSCDLAPLDGCQASNHGEYLYLTPPDAIQPPYNTPNAIKEILAHEVAHLLHFQRKVLRNHLQTWQDGVYLSEGIGALAQDVTGFQAGNLYVTRAALDGIEQFSLADVLHGEEPDRARQGVLRGGGYLFVRYLYDRAGGDRASGLELENTGGPSLVRALLDSPQWIDQALPSVAGADLTRLQLDFYTALALSNREEAGAAPAANPCFQYLPTSVDPVTQKQRGANLFAHFHGSQMQGPQLGDARAPDGTLLTGGVEYLSLEASAPETSFSLQLEPTSMPRLRIARLR
jgi:hypothetical protein